MELIQKEIVDLLNYRINKEEHSSRIYFAMHEWLDANGYFGASKMMQAWSEEEMEHAGWARAFLEDYDFLPKVDAIGSVQTEYSSLMDVMKAAYKHEVDITDQCNTLTTEIVKKNCFHALPLALKYMSEQRDELGKTSGWLDRLDLAKDDTRELMMIDREMGAEYGGTMIG